MEVVTREPPAPLPPRVAAAAAATAAGTCRDKFFIIVYYRGRCCRYRRRRRRAERLCGLVPAGQVFGFRPGERDRVLDLVEIIGSIVLCAYER